MTSATLKKVNELCDALAKAEAERDAEKSRAAQLEDSLDLAQDEFARIRSLTKDEEIRGLCDRGRSEIRQNVHVIVQRDRAQSERDALKARAERAEAAWGRCAALCNALLWEGTRPACMTTQQRAIKSARAAVDAAGDLTEGVAT